MSHADHEWAKEQIAVHLAGGLPAEERARLEAHAATCAECIAEIDAARRFDRQMDDLFSPVRAKAGLEERVIRGLRSAPLRASRTLASRVILAAAAVLLMGILGFVIISVDQGKLSITETVALQDARQTEKSVQPNEPMLSVTSLEREGVPRLGALVSADELALQRVPALKQAEESDHNESAGREHRYKSLAMPKSAPAPMSPPPPPVAKMPEMPRQQQGQPGKPADGPAGGFQGQDKYFGYRDDRAAQNRAVDGVFALVETDKELKDVAGKDPGMNKLAKVENQKGLASGGGAGQGGDAKRQTKANEYNESKQLAAAKKLDEPQNQDPQPDKAQRKIIRTGEVEYEIESFDSSLATISKLVEEEAGFVATVNSDKLPNGKVRGTVVLRLPPERLDTLLLKLRGLGELKSQNIRSQDVGKQYYDLESRLKAARTMEERLLKIIKEGKGEIKDLLLAEKELGEWRTKIETFEGEKRYYDNQIGLSTLTVTLSEKEIRGPSGITQTERVDMGIEVEDVEKAHKDGLAAVAEAKGRVTKSDLRQLEAGKYSATLNFEVSPDAAGPLRDRFKQLGYVARLVVDRVQETEGGIGKVAELLKVKQKDTVFQVSIYNLATTLPREVVVLNLACNDAEASFKTIMSRVDKANGRVLTSSLNRQRNDQTTGQVVFEIKAAEADAVLADVRNAGEVIRLDVNENRDTQGVTRSKKGFQVQLFAMGLVEPRETMTLQVASKDVPAAYRALLEAAQGVEARILSSQLNENDRQNVNASLSFDFRKENDAKMQAALGAAGEVLSRLVTRAQDVERVVDSRKRLVLTLVNLANIPIRETYTIAVEADAVDAAVGQVEKMAAELKGRIVDSRHTRGTGGRNVSKIVVDLPLGAARGAADRVKAMGALRVFDATRNPQAPEGDLAMGRIEVTFSNPSQLVDSDSGPWARIKGGLSVGLTALSWSLTLVIVGLCFAVPVGLLFWGGVKIYRKSKAGGAPAA